MSTSERVLPPDPSKATRAELAARMAESVAAIGALAKFSGKAASSPALHSTVTSFAEHEGMIESTSTMLLKINQGLIDLDAELGEISNALSPSQPAQEPHNHQQQKPSQDRS